MTDVLRKLITGPTPRPTRTPTPIANSQLVGDGDQNNDPLAMVKAALASPSPETLEKASGGLIRAQVPGLGNAESRKGFERHPAMDGADRSKPVKSLSLEDVTAYMASLSNEDRARLIITAMVKTRTRKEF
jgi:hypothetical protein